MDEERERGAEGEAVEPERDFGQLDGHWVDVYAVNTALEDVTLEEVDVREAFGVYRDSLIVHFLKDRFAHAEEMRDDGIPGESVQKIESFIRDVVYSFDQEVTGAHGRIEDLDIEQLIYDRAPPFLYSRAVFVLANLLTFLLGEVNGVS